MLDVREVAGCVHRIVDERRVPEPVVQLGAHGDGVEEVLLQRLVASLQVVRPTDRTDARRAVGQRYEPEPAVLEPTDADVALALALEPAGIAKVTEQRRAVVVGVLLLALELVREQCVTTAGIDDELGAPAARLTLGENRADHSTVCIEVDLSDLRAFERQRALLPRMAKQQFIQLGAPNLPSRVLRRIPALGKVHVAAVVEIGRDEFNAELRHADIRDLILDAKSIEKLDIPRQQRLADVKAGMMVFLE